MFAVAQVAAALELIKPLDASQDAAVRNRGERKRYLRTEGRNPLCNPLPLGGKGFHLQPVNAVFHGCTSVKFCCLMSSYAASGKRCVRKK
jgi:hypothetical protein